jgi:hypothetical protein
VTPGQSPRRSGEDVEILASSFPQSDGLPYKNLLFRGLISPCLSATSDVPSASEG